MCLGLSEILTNASHANIELYLDILVEALQEALCDLNDNVRIQAGQAFQTLFKSLWIGFSKKFFFFNFKSIFKKTLFFKLLFLFLNQF